MKAILFVSTLAVIMTMGVQGVSAAKGRPMWTCEKWLAMCNPNGHCNNPKALVQPDCSHHGHA